MRHKPYLLSSNSSDAFLLGVKARAEGLPADAPLHKSTGYDWLLNGVRYRVDFERITTA